MDESYYTPRFEDQSAHILPPLAPYHAGPAGFKYNPGTALSEQWKEHFFVMSFRGSRANSPLYAFTLEEDGARSEERRVWQERERQRATEVRREKGRSQRWVR